MQHQEFDQQLCHFHAGLTQRGTRKCCAISLFKEDIRQTQAVCPCHGGIQRLPSEEKKRWALLAIGPHDVTFSCPTNVPNSPPRLLTLPAIGIIEVPPGCEKLKQELSRKK